MINISHKKNLKKLITLSLSLLFILTSLFASDPPVFPGAEGFGTTTPAGRGGVIYRVTNLNESGPGSLREGVEMMTGPRIIIFEISGTLDIRQELPILDPYITIAGQTAPSPGFTIRGAGFRIATHDVLIQHLRLRVGDDPDGVAPELRRGMSVGVNSYNVVIDHCSMSWGVDSNATIWGRGIHDITYSNCIFSEGLEDSIHPKGPHSRALSVGPGEIRDVAILRNLFAHNALRNPLIHGNTHTLIVNNVVYNTQYYAAVLTEDDADREGPQSSSIVGCITIPGADSITANHSVEVLDVVSQGVRLYVEDNLCPHIVSNDPWSSVRILCPESYVIKENSPSVWTSPLTKIPTSNSQALNYVLDNSGARPADRDSVDIRIVNDVRNGTGRIIDRPGQVGGWPNLAVNHRTLNSPNNPYGDDDSDGYTNLEEWLHTYSAAVEGTTPPPSHTVSKPNTPSGNSSLEKNTAYTYSTGGSTCSLDHNVQYRFDWGDGNISAWSNSQSASHSWLNSGIYSIKAQARCATDTSVVSQWSSGKTASVATDAHTITVPNIPVCPSSGDVNIQYTFTTGGSVCSQGHNVEYRFYWGDGFYSGWTTADSKPHSWSKAGTYIIIAQARCANDNTILSEWSAGKAITISGPHTVTNPATPSGPDSGNVNSAYIFSTGSSTCSLGHVVQYRYDWGDGSSSNWSSSNKASHSWSQSGTYPVKAQARCSVDTAVVSGWSSSKNITLTVSPNPTVSLTLSSQTESPAPGIGGTTQPSPGSYSYSVGNSVQVTALPKTNYRFFKWAGNITSSQSENPAFNLVLNNNVSLTAHFATRCGDINGDLKVSPTDSQMAFDLFLGLLPNATAAMRENADVNCDGTKTIPRITPTDAQAIFEKFLGLSELPGDCSCRARTAGEIIEISGRSEDLQEARSKVRIDNYRVRSTGEIEVSFIIEDNIDMKAFGLDILVPNEAFQFTGIKKDNLHDKFIRVDANILDDGIVRVGGFSQFPVPVQQNETLVTLVFKQIKTTTERFSIQILNTYDDLDTAPPTYENLLNR